MNKNRSPHGVPDKGIINRLHRARGQIDAVKRMLDSPEQYSCKEVVSQLKAARSALRKVSELYVASRIVECASLPEPERSKHIALALEALAVE